MSIDKCLGSEFWKKEERSFPFKSMVHYGGKLPLSEKDKIKSCLCFAVSGTAISLGPQPKKVVAHSARYILPAYSTLDDILM